MKIAVTGALSYSGKYIAQRLLSRGEEVITLTGHPNRSHPFNGKLRTFPLNFDDERGLREALGDTDVLVNTYWVRFKRGGTSHAQAVENTQKLINAAVSSGVKRIIHLSVTNPSADSALPYYWGKAATEKLAAESGMTHAILRPSLIFGTEDILVHNIAFLLRRLPFFALPGDGSYRAQPVYVEDVADLAVEAIYRKDNYAIDAVGPDIFTFKEMVNLIGEKVGAKRPVIPVPPRLALLAAQFLSLFLGDILLTPQEIDGLMADLLVSKEPPRCTTRLVDWLEINKDKVGAGYASELKRHYR